MNTVLILILFLLESQTRADVYDHSFTPSLNYQVQQNHSRLKKLYGEGSSGMLCWPSSLAHRMAYYQIHHNPPLAQLKLKLNPVDSVEKLVALCRTNPNAGTSQKRKLPCIRQLFKEAGYIVDAFSVGPDAEEFKRPVEVKDLFENLSKKSAVILHVAWWKFNEKTQAWVETGSHSLNAYGFNYNNSWSQNRIFLMVANPGENYADRPEGQMYDSVEVLRLEKKMQVAYPKMVELGVTGRGFKSDQYHLAAIKNIFVFTPRL